MSVPEPGADKPLAKLDFLAGQQLPIDVPSVQIAENGTLEARNPDSEFTFSFVSFGIRFEASVGQENADHFLLIEGNLGPIPYRAEAPVLRSDILAIVRTNSEFDVPIFLINPQHQLLVRVAVPVNPPQTAGALIAAAVQALVIMRPYLELVEEKFLKAQAAEMAEATADDQLACG